MKVNLPVHAFALAAVPLVPVREARRVGLPEPGFRARKSRASSLAWDLCEATLGGVELGADASVLIGTALGCLTETEAFVENMIQGEGMAPKPRAFTASVHNALASDVARRLRARGECQTFVGGENSHVQALIAAACARSRGTRVDQLVGALDEWTDYVERGRRSCETAPQRAEGGALFHLGREEDPRPPLVRLRGLALARPADPATWLRTQLEAWRPQATLGSRSVVQQLGPLAIDMSEFVGDFPAGGALNLALAVALASEECNGEFLGLATTPRRLAVVSRTRFGEWGLVLVESAR